MVGLRGLFHHSFVLVYGASARRAVAVQREFAVPGAGPGVGHDVDWHGLPYGTLAARSYLFDVLELASGRCFLCGGHLPLFPIRSALQLEATRRLARSIAESAGAAAGHDRDTLTRAASGVPGAFMRNGGVDPRDWACGLLESDRFCRHHGSYDDSHGGRGIGEAVRDRVQAVPALSSGCAAENTPMTMPHFHPRRVRKTVVYEPYTAAFEAAAQ
jgi:hypothetical protein